MPSFVFTDAAGRVLGHHDGSREAMAARLWLQGAGQAWIRGGGFAGYVKPCLQDPGGSCRLTLGKGGLSVVHAVGGGP